MDEVESRDLWAGAERRIHHRVPLAVSCDIDFDDGRESVGGVDISMGGVCVSRPRETGVGGGIGGLEVGHRVTVTVRLPRGGCARASSEVVRASGRSIALRFVRLDAPSLIAIAAHLADAA